MGALKRPTPNKRDEESRWHGCVNVIRRLWLYRRLVTLLLLICACLAASACAPRRSGSGIGALSTETQPAATAAAPLPGPTQRTRTPAPTGAPVSAPTAAPQPARMPSAVLTPNLPTEHYIPAIRGHKQYFKLGCEAAAAKDWANFLGFDFNEFEFQYKLPLSDNPDYGFVGDVNAPWGQVPPYGYGVNAGPVADLLNTYGVPAKSYKGYTLDQLTAKIAADKPVIAWVIGNVVGGIPSEYTDKEGRKVTVAAYEHVVIVTGYNEKKLRYMTNGKFFETPKEVFLNSWGVLGNMVVVDK